MRPVAEANFVQLTIVAQLFSFIFFTILTLKTVIIKLANMMRKCRLCCSSVTALVAVSMIILGGVLISVFATLIHNTIADSVVLKPGAEAYENWQNPPVPVYMQFWVFDLMNKDEVVENGSKPVVTERGPYTYREIRPKSNITFHHNGTLSYRQNKTYVFVPDMSAGSQNDTITTVNLLYVTVVGLFEDSAGPVKFLVNDALKIVGEHLFDTYTVHDLIWGYRVKALKELADIIHVFSPSTKIPYDIGLFADINGTDDGVYTIGTGADDVTQVNQIDNWKGQRKLPFWGTSYCNMINGTDGTAYQPFLEKSDRLYVFSSDICRSIYVDYMEDVTLRGVDLYRFTPPSDVFGNVTDNPDNIGYCTPNCLGAGVLNVSVCKGAPVIMSQPHFYQGAPEYIEAIGGMNPIADEHRTVLDMEPHTGLVLNAAKRLQVNIYIKEIDGISDTEKLPKLTIYPVVWINESASLDQTSADKFHREVMVPILVTQIVQFGLITLGAVLLLIVIVLTVKHVYGHRYLSESGPDAGASQIQYSNI